MKGWATLLVLFLALAYFPFAGAKGDDGTWVIDDESGDQTLRYLQTEPRDNPFPTWGRHLDIVKVTMGGEDAVGVGIDVQFEEFTLAETSPAGGTISCFNGSTMPNGREEVHIKFEYKQGFPFHVQLYFTGQWDAAGSTFYIQDANACLCPVSPTQQMSFCPKQKVDVTLEDAKDRVHVWVPKASLAGKNPLPQPWGLTPDPSFRFPELIALGDTLSDLQVETWSQAFGSVPLGQSSVNALGSFAPYLHDIAPETGQSPQYVFHEPTANQAVRLSLETRGPYLPVRADANQSITFLLENAGDNRRLISLEYDLVGPDDRVQHYRVYGPGRATLPAFEKRVLRFYLDIGPGALPDDNVTLQVQGTSAGYGEVGFAESILAPGPHLGVDSDTLFALMREQPYPCYTEPDGKCYTMFLSPLEDDPLGVSSGRVYQRWGTRELSPNRWYTRGSIETLGQGTPSPLAFQSGGKVHIELSFDLGHAIENVDYTVSLITSNATVQNRQVATVEGTADLTAPKATVVVDAPLARDLTTLSRGSRFELVWEMAAEVSPGIASSWATSFLRPIDTFVKLPLTELPPELQNRAVPSPFQLAVLGAREEFVNPGEGRVMNVTVLNQDVSPHTARLTAVVEAEGWTVELLPGDLFQLEAGDLIRVGVLARAPLDAAEGARAVIRFNVTDEMGRALPDQFTLVVATQIDLADDSADFRVDSEAAERLVTQAKKDTPAPALAWILGALAVALLLGRRGSP